MITVYVLLSLLASFPIFHKFILQPVFSGFLEAILFHILINSQHMFFDTQVAILITFRQQKSIFSKTLGRYTARDIEKWGTTQYYHRIKHHQLPHYRLTNRKYSANRKNLIPDNSHQKSLDTSHIFILHATFIPLLPPNNVGYRKIYTRQSKNLTCPLTLSVS